MNAWGFNIVMSAAVWYEWTKGSRGKWQAWMCERVEESGCSMSRAGGGWMGKALSSSLSNKCALALATAEVVSPSSLPPWRIRGESLHFPHQVAQAWWCRMIARALSHVRELLGGHSGYAMVEKVSKGE